MWNQLLTLEVPLLEKVVRTFLVYVLIIVLLRWGGKCGLASMNTLDFVVVFLLAGTVETAIVGEDNSVLGAGISAVTLVAVNAGFAWLIDHSTLAQRIFEGQPTTLIEKGEVLRPALRKLGMRTSELDHAIRSQHGDNIEEIEHGELTPSGQFVLTLKPEEQSSTKGDITALEERLERIESILSAQR